MNVLRIWLAGLALVILRRIFATRRRKNIFCVPAYCRGKDAWIARGMERHVHHPMYSCVMSALPARPVQAVNSLNLFTITILYFTIGSQFEEQRMQTIHSEYADNQRRASAFISCPESGRVHE